MGKSASILGGAITVGRLDLRQEKEQVMKMLVRLKEVKGRSLLTEYLTDAVCASCCGYGGPEAQNTTRRTVFVSQCLGASGPP